MAVPGSGTPSLLKIWSEKNEHDYTANNSDGEDSFNKLSVPLPGTAIISASLYHV